MNDMKARSIGATTMVQIMDRIENKTGRAPTHIIDGSKGYARVVEARPYVEGEAQEDYAADWLREWMRAR